VKEAEREVRIGWVAAACVIVCVLHTANIATIAATAPLLVVLTLVNPAVGLGVAVGSAALLLLVVGLAIATLVRIRRLQPGTKGRTRVIVVAISGLVHAVGFACTWALSIWAALQPGGVILGGRLDWTALQMAMPQVLEVLFWVCAVVASLGSLGMIGGSVASWFILPERGRRIFWYAADAVIAIAFLAATLLLPLAPPSDAPDAVLLPALRLTATVIFAVRAVARLLGPSLNLVEGLGFHALVAARHLRTRKSNFLAAIGILSILAVTVSSCALTTTLSVMGGFRNDLKRKILGNNAHVVIDREHRTFDRWGPVLERTRHTEGVIGAAPYVSGEVMVTSASNLAGAVLRGIDPRTVGDVVDLRANMTRGRLEYLIEPERLLDLPADEMRGPRPLETPRRIRRQRDDDESPPDGQRSSPVRDVDDLLDDPMGDMPRLPSSDIEDIDRYLRGPSPLRGPQDVLPGVIVGQELARSLRLFVGDEVNVVSPLGDLGPAGPMPKSRPFRVAGIFYSGMYEYDMKYVYVTLENAQRFLNTGDEISGIEIKVDNTDRAPVIAAALRRSIGRTDLRVQDWQQVNRNLFGALALEKLAMFIVLGIAILVAGFCVFGTLTLMVQEKGREVGVLKALGSGGGAIVQVFMIEGALIGFLGSALGLGLGYVVCFAAQHFGIGMNPEVYYIDKLPVHTDPMEFSAVGVASVVVCLVATVFPAVLASRLRPVDALRYE